MGASRARPRTRRSPVELERRRGAERGVGCADECAEAELTAQLGLGGVEESPVPFWTQRRWPRVCVRVSLRACVCVRMRVCVRARAHGMGTVWPFAEAYLLTPAVCGGRAGASTV